MRAFEIFTKKKIHKYLRNRTNFQKCSYRKCTKIKIYTICGRKIVTSHGKLPKIQLLLYQKYSENCKKICEKIFWYCTQIQKIIGKFLGKSWNCTQIRIIFGKCMKICWKIFAIDRKKLSENA